MIQKKKQFAIGIFVLVALVISGFGLLYLKPKIGDAKGFYFVRFSSLERVNAGSRVMFAGQPVGEVKAIQFVSNAREQKSDPQGSPYFYELKITVDSSVKLYETDSISLNTSGLFGEKSVLITPHVIAPGRPLPRRLEYGETVYAESREPYQEVMNEILSVSKKLNTFVESNNQNLTEAVLAMGQSFSQATKMLETVNQTKAIVSFQEGMNSIGDAMEEISLHSKDIRKGHLIENASQTVENINQITKAINQPQVLQEITHNLNGVLHNLNTWNQRLDTSWPALEKSLQNILETSSDAKKTFSHLANIAQDVENGQGNIGKIFKRDDIYLLFVTILNKANTLMNDLNNYGLLFNSNSEWKKLRRQRIAEYNKIKTPQQLVVYFEKELDLLGSSLSRMHQASEYPPAKLSSQEKQRFKMAFKEVLQRLNHIQESVKLYNEAVQEKE